MLFILKHLFIFFFFYTGKDKMKKRPLEKNIYIYFNSISLPRPCTRSSQTSSHSAKLCALVLHPSITPSLGALFPGDTCASALAGLQHKSKARPRTCLPQLRLSKAGEKQPLPQPGEQGAQGQASLLAAFSRSN